MLNVGRGKRPRIWLWGKQQEERPAVDLLFPQLPLAWIGACVGACAWLVARSAMSCPKWAGHWFLDSRHARRPSASFCHALALRSSGMCHWQDATGMAMVLQGQSITNHVATSSSPQTAHNIMPAGVRG
jgi:hypothetical protein